MRTPAQKDDEELEILQAWEAGLLTPVKDMAEQIKAHRAVVTTMLKETHGKVEPKP